MRIEKKNLRNFIKVVTEKYRFFAPVAEDGNVQFKDVSKSGEVSFDYLNSMTNPKNLFFPQSEVMYNFTKEEIIPIPLPSEKFVVFGLRPCDVHGLQAVDRVYLSEDFRDVSYSARRENGILITLACNNPDTTCFCTGIGGDPAREEGSDVIAYEDGETVIMKSVSKKGVDFLKGYNKKFKSATKADFNKANKSIQDASRKQLKTKIDAEAVKKSLDKNFENSYWGEIHHRCIGCGICTYLCPTCYCFDITDEMRGVEGQRLRTWDSCMFRLFTLHGSGHNPRTTQKERFRQRVMHKFKYLMDNCQVTGCTGCGRCVRECPVNLDIRKVVQEVTQLKAVVQS